MLVGKWENDYDFPYIYIYIYIYHKMMSFYRNKALLSYTFNTDS